MKKYCVMKSVNICAVLLLLCGVLLFVLGMISISASGILSYLIKYGFNSLNADNKTTLFMCVLDIVAFPVFMKKAEVISGRFICVSQEKVYGNLGVGFMSKEVEFSYQEIIASDCKKDGVTIDTVKGTFYFPKIQSAAECCKLINEKLDYTKGKDE